MELLKSKLIEVMSRTLPMEKFEAWLYADEYVKDRILVSDLVLEMLSIDLRSKHAFSEIEKLCFYHYGKEEVKLFIVEMNCIEYVENPSKKGAGRFLDNVYKFYDWEDDYILFSQIDLFCSDWSMITDGYYLSGEFMLQFNKFVNDIMYKLENADMSKRLEVLNKGVCIENNCTVPQETSISVTPIVKHRKRWFQFWK